MSQSIFFDKQGPSARTREEGEHPTKLALRVGDSLVRVTDDPYSDRIRCDHPEVEQPRELGEALVHRAHDLGRGRVVALVPVSYREEMEQAGLVEEALMPGFYSGEEDCSVLGYYPDPERQRLVNPREVASVEALIDSCPPGRAHPTVETRRAEPNDAPAIAHLIGQTFEEYPTPSSEPTYIEKQIRDGIPFRFVEVGGEVVACASADLVTGAKTAELTDCATLPSQRGRGLMQSILTDLVEDLRAMDYQTAFTMARARIAGMNLAFLRLGFEFRGQMTSSCRIGQGIEDMNVWSIAL